MRNQPMDCKNPVGVKVGAQFKNSPNGKAQKSPARSWYVGQGVDREFLSQQTVDSVGNFNSPGGPYSGPVLADVEKSIRGAQGGSMAVKRKNKDEDSN